MRTRKVFSNTSDPGRETALHRPPSRARRLASAIEADAPDLAEPAGDGGARGTDPDGLGGICPGPRAEPGPEATWPLSGGGPVGVPRGLLDLGLRPETGVPPVGTPGAGGGGGGAPLARCLSESLSAPESEFTGFKSGLGARVGVPSVGVPA